MVKECGNCPHDITFHNEEGCQKCDCRYSPDAIERSHRELAEASKLVKRECWVVTYNLTEHLFTGQVRIHFLFEPTREEVLEALSDGGEAPKRAVERVKAGNYTVVKGHVMERPL